MRSPIISFLGGLLSVYWDCALAVVLAFILGGRPNSSGCGTAEGKAGRGLQLHPGMIVGFVNCPIGIDETGMVPCGTIIYMLVTNHYSSYFIDFTPV